MSPDSDQKHEDYMHIFEIVLDSQKDMLGDKVAFKYIRKAPLEVDLNGEIGDYYGKGEDVLDIIVGQYEKVWGEDVADRKIGRKLKEELDEDKWNLLTEDLRNVEEKKGFITQLKESILG